MAKDPFKNAMAEIDKATAKAEATARDNTASPTERDLAAKQARRLSEARMCLTNATGQRPYVKSGKYAVPSIFPKGTPNNKKAAK